MAQRVRMQPFDADDQPGPRDDRVDALARQTSSARVQEYDDDPLTGQLGTVDGYLALLDLLTGAYDGKGFEGAGNLLPVKILAGECDPCAGGPKGVSSGCAYLKKVGFARTEMKLYPGMRHEIHMEDGRDEVFADILEAFT